MYSLLMDANKLMILNIQDVNMIIKDHISLYNYLEYVHLHKDKNQGPIFLKFNSKIKLGGQLIYEGGIYDLKSVKNCILRILAFQNRFQSLDVKYSILINS